MNYKVFSAFGALLLISLTTRAAGGDFLTGYSSLMKEGADDNTVAALQKQRVIYQDFDPTMTGVETADGFKISYTGNSIAFTGNGCSVNKLVTVVGVANAYMDMDRLVDDDLTNAATIAKGLAAKVTVDPLVSVRDSRHYYAKGTTAGFCVVASGSSALSLSVVKAFAIGFYRDGTLVGTAAVTEGQSASGVNLSLVQIGADGVMTLTATAPDMFDEISLNPANGVGLELTSDLNVKYAFAGKQQTHILNRDWTSQEGDFNDKHEVKHTGGITKYNEQTGRQLKIDYALVNGSPVDAILGYDKFVEDPEEGAVLSAVIAIGSSGSAEIHLVDEANPDREVFPAGTEIGFKIKSNGLLDLTAGKGSYIRFYTKDYDNTLTGRDYKTYEEVTLNAGVLDLKVVEVDKDGQLMSAVAPMDFSGAKLFLGTGLGINLGDIECNYAYVREKPVQIHRCALQQSSNVYLADGVTSHQISWNSNLGLPVKFTLTSKPEGSSATVSDDGLLSGIDMKGKYIVKMQVEGAGHEDCNGEVVIVNDQFEHNDDMLAGGCGDPLINTDDAVTYAISTEVYESSGSLLSLSDKSDIENVVDGDPTNFALYVGGLSIADNVRIIGVKRVDGEPVSDGTAAKRVGFVVEESTDGLNAKALEFLQIRCYYKAQKGSDAIYTHVIDESNAISAQVIGSGKTTKVRYSIEVPAGYKFDEFQLWTSGVLKLNVSNIKVYYPFVEDAGSPCSTLLGCNGEMIGAEATVTPLQAGGVDVAQFVDNTSFLIDDDQNTCMTVQNTVSVGGGVKVRVNLGRLVHTSQNVGIILDDRTLLAGIKAGNWLTVRLYNTLTGASGAALYAGTADPTLVKEFTDWHVTDAKVAGSGDKRALYFTPPAPFNEIELEIANIAGVTDTQKFYGICLRGDSNQDGVPDCMEPEPVKGPLTGIGSVPSIDSALAVTLEGNVATASCPGARISRLLVYDLAGANIIYADGRNADSASVTLPSGLCVLQVIFDNGDSRSVKLLAR